MYVSARFPLKTASEDWWRSVSYKIKGKEPKWVSYEAFLDELEESFNDNYTRGDAQEKIASAIKHSGQNITHYVNYMRKLNLDTGFPADRV